MKKFLGRTLTLASILALLDQISKKIVLENLQNLPLEITDFFRLTYSENPGIAFGFKLPQPFLIVLTFVLVFAVLYIVKTDLKINHPLTQLSIALIIGGGMGNLIDRLLYGHVTDFISFWNYPIFNLADIFITTGVLLAVAFYGKIKKA